MLNGPSCRACWSGHSNHLSGTERIAAPTTRSFRISGTNRLHLCDKLPSPSARCCLRLYKVQFPIAKRTSACTPEPCAAIPWLLGSLAGRGRAALAKLKCPRQLVILGGLFVIHFKSSEMEKLEQARPPQLCTRRDGGCSSSTSCHLYHG